MIIDCHFHVDESMLTLEKMIEEMDKNNVSKTVLIPPMNETMFDTDSNVQHYVHSLFRFLILNVPQIGFKIYVSLVEDGYFKVNGKHKVITKPDNDIVADAINKFPERFLGWAAVNPLISESVEELESYLERPGFIGVKAHPFMHGYTIKKLNPIASLCQEKGIPIIIHLSSEPYSYKYLPDKYPNLKVIYAHAGLPFWKKLWKYAKDQPNVFVDSSSDYLSASMVEKVVDALGYRKVLYGCDGPYGMKRFNEYDYSHKKSWVDSLEIPEHQKEYIFGKNFLSLIEKGQRDRPLVPL
ncbi:amidohydrolase family protein [Aquibacillus halophilus]|uniref:Amidohydrolase family protein n=1 Tax=Aquibacillus halophilus TaxID=930132 RepID=A0A6A8D7A6_9BACI|nr:amidohydrolase family protein [Aquibacillus halophilus]MRH41464.1 amidohydrolase family protein [Aquibacillus halophilus]